MMVVDLLEADILFPLHSDEITAHASQHLLVDIAFRCKDGIEVYCFDPTAMVPFDWHSFMQCVFRWATFCGVLPISMIGGHLPRTGYDLEEEFQMWLLDVKNDAKVTAFS